MTVLEVRCNGCDVLGARRYPAKEPRGGGLRVHDLRGRLARKGWVHLLPGGKDWCPECLRSGKYRPRRARR